MGIEQMVWAPIGLVALAKVLVAQRARLRVPPFALWSLLFLAIHFASGMFIVEEMRVITFARTFGGYASATVWVLVLVNTIGSLRDAKRILAAAAFATATAAVAGMAGILGVWRGGFTSAMGTLLPQSIASTTYGGHIVVRSTGGMDWFVIIGDYYRVDSFFLFATLFATSIAVSLPIVFWLIRTAPRLWIKGVWSLSALLMLINLPFTTGRVAMASFCAGGAWFILAGRPLRLLPVILLMTSATTALFSSNEAMTLARLGVETAAYARGSGSVDTRGAVYRSTIEGFLERPVLGWGTERDVPDQPYPAGSHSTYLGHLYKYGAVGFICYLGVLISAWVTTRPEQGLRGTAEDQLLRYGRWTLVTVVLNGFTDVLDLDATTLILIYAIIATLVAVRRLPR